MNKYLVLVLVIVVIFFVVGVKVNIYGFVYMDIYEWLGLYGDNVMKEVGIDMFYVVGVEVGYMDEMFNVYGFYEEYLLNS